MWLSGAPLLLCALLGIAMPTLGAVQRDSDAMNSVFFINLCAEDAICCLEGYVGLVEGGHLAINVAGFSSVCGEDLTWGFDEISPRAMSQKLPGTFSGNVSIPAANGLESVQVTITGNQIQLKSLSSSPILATASGIRMTTFEEALKDGVIRDPTIDAIATGWSLDVGSAPDIGGRVVLSFVLVVFVSVFIYFFWGFLWAKRNGGTWDGPCRHVHGSYFALCWESHAQCGYSLQRCSRKELGEKVQNIRRSSSISTVLAGSMRAFRMGARQKGDVVEGMEDGMVIGRTTSFSSSPKKPKSRPPLHSEQDSMEDVSIDVEPEGSGSPSKSRRAKKDWTFGLKSVPIVDGVNHSSTSAFVAVGMERPDSIARAVQSPSDQRRRNSLSHRVGHSSTTTLAVHDSSRTETRGDFV